MNEILDYIRANRTRYTREAISQQLLSAGHSRQAVAQAWEAADTEAPPAGGASGFIKGYSVLVFLLGAAFQALVVINAITAVLYLPSDAVVVLTGILGALIGAAIYLGVGLLALRFIFRQADEGHPGVGWGIAAGCLVPILVFGLCTAAALPGLLLYQL